VENIEFKAKVEKPSKVSFLQKIPSKIKSPKILIYALLLVSLPTSVLLVKTVQDIRQRASGLPATPPNPPSEKAQALKLEPKGFVYIANNFVYKSPLTIEAWIKPQVDQNNNVFTVFSTYKQYPTCSATFGLDIERDYMYNPTKYRTKTNIQTNNRSIGFGGTNLYDYDKWMHIAITYDIDGKLITYVNGSIDNSQQLDGTLCPNPMDLRIGTFTGDGNTTYYNGLIDEVRISNIVRKSSGFGSLLPLEPDSNTIALYKFENNTNDSSTNSFHGSVFGTVSYIDSIVQPTPTPVISMCGSACSSNSQCTSAGGCSICSNGVCSPPVGTPYPTVIGMSPTPTIQPPIPSPCGQYGDIDGNYMITSSDQKAILEIVAGLPYKDWQIKNADVDGDGKVTASDSLIVARYLAGLETTFPVCKPKSTPTPGITYYPTPSPSLYPDLTIDTANGGGLSTSWKVGSLSNPVNVKFRIINQGSAPASAQYIYTNQSEGYSTLGSDNTCTASTILSPGKSCISSYNFVFKSYGTKYFTISIDPYNQVKESVESNNIFDTKVLLFQMSPTPAYGTPPVTPKPTLQPTPTYGVPKVTPTPTPAPKMCPASLNSVRYLDSCRYLFFGKGARSIQYACSDKYQGTIRVSSCTSTSDLNKQASAACAKRKTYCTNQ